MTTTLGDRFASCENIVFRFQTSSLPPPPATVYHLLVKNNKGMGGGLINFVPLKREGLLERGGLIEDLQKFFPFTLIVWVQRMGDHRHVPVWVVWIQYHNTIPVMTIFL